jgi:preprotein translocase subunit SecE
MSREDKRRIEREERRTEDQPSAATESSSSERTSPAQFLREVKGELKKVAWPSRKEVLSYSVVVLVLTLVLVGIVWAMDWVIREAVFNTLG